MEADHAARLSHPERLAALRRLGLLDTPAVPALDRLTRLATRALRAPISLITLVDANRQFFASSCGLAEPWAAVRQTPLTHSVCQYVVATGRPLIITDTRAHPLVRESQAVRDLRVVAYAGYPLTTAGQHHIGTFCAIHDVPHRWSPDELEIIREFADITLHEVTLATTLRTHVQNQAVLRASEARYRALFEQALVGIFHSTPDGRLTAANPALVQMLGCAAPADVLGLRLGDLACDPEVWTRALAQAHTPAAREGSDVRWLRRDGVQLMVRILARPLHDPVDGATGYLGVVLDITERSRLEAQVRHMQKLESVGQLAGGIAHDFNNLLTAILGFAELAQTSLPAGALAQTDLTQIRRAAERGARLTRQLLVFARRQASEPRVLDLSALIGDAAAMLRQLIGEAVALELRLASDLWPVSADPGQIEQVLVNLVVNARDAMPQGGTVTLSTVNVAVDPALAARLGGLRPGDYIQLDVRDTGVGMDAVVQQHLFEPFFTTKAVGHGTGMGLATCYGIATQYGGSIVVQSTVGGGTTVSLYLPRSQHSADPAPAPALDEALPRGSETVLVVEDDELVRGFAVRVLRQLGYRVLEAPNGQAGLALAAAYSQRIDLLLADLVMPEVGGATLAEQLLAERPGLSILFMSGYADHPQAPDVPAGRRCLAKPFTPAVLARAVREALGARNPPQAAGLEP